MRASSVTVLILRTLRVYHLAATAAEAATKQMVGAMSKASCFPLMMSKRSLVVVSAMMVAVGLRSRPHSTIERRLRNRRQGVGRSRSRGRSYSPHVRVDAYKAK